jgi:hypothetical protein
MGFFKKYLFNLLALKKISFIYNLFYFINIKRKNFYIFEKNESKNLSNKLHRSSRLIKYRIRKNYYSKLFGNKVINKIFISKPNIKHSLNEVIITLYIYNREKYYFLKKLSLLNKLFFNLIKKNKISKEKRKSLLKRLKKVNYTFKYTTMELYLNYLIRNYYITKKIYINLTIILNLLILI